jgi:hypothetical protein
MLPENEIAEEKMMMEKNIRAFLAAARTYLLELVQPANATEVRLATIPVRRH